MIYINEKLKKSLRSYLYLTTVNISKNFLTKEMYNLNKITEVSIMQINMVQMKEITLDSDLREPRKGREHFFYT